MPVDEGGEMEVFIDDVGGGGDGVTRVRDFLRKFESRKNNFIGGKF
jgi:hypothetical protein